MSKPIAVLIADVHYSLKTLAIADAAVRMAIDKANQLNVPLVVAGDLHDTKSNLRGECVNAMLETFKRCSQRPYIIVGNHCRFNEHAPEHSLNFLELYAFVVDFPMRDSILGHILPYYHDPDELRAYLKTVPKGSRLIMHQGVQGTNMGDYIQDKSAITKEDVAGLRVLSGHYHTRQTIELPDNGQWDYIGNPFTLSFGEARDPEKGFQILMDDGSLEFVPTNLRKHVVIDFNVGPGFIAKEIDTADANPGDLVWVKLRGPRAELSKITRDDIQKYFNLDAFKLEFIPDDTDIQPVATTSNKTDLMDLLIDAVKNADPDQKQRLKALWRDLK